MSSKKATKQSKKTAKRHARQARAYAAYKPSFYYLDLPSKQRIVERYGL